MFNLELVGAVILGLVLGGLLIDYLAKKHPIDFIDW